MLSLLSRTRLGIVQGQHFLLFNSIFTKLVKCPRSHSNKGLSCFYSVYWLGETPTRLENSLEKCERSEYPDIAATSATEKLPSESRDFAYSILVLIRYPLLNTLVFIFSGSDTIMLFEPGDKL